MQRTYPSVLKYIGFPVVGAAWVLAARLVWEQTILSWRHGPQMIGFSLMHSGPGALLILAVLAGLVWVAAVFIAAVLSRSYGGKLVLAQLAAYALAWCLLVVPYGFWQRIFISKYSSSQAVDFLLYASAVGDLQTVKAFVEHGVAVDAQEREGTALHGAAVQGKLEVIEYLLQHDADVNAINAYGNSPLANAMEARQRAAETQALLARHGGILVRESMEQRNRVIEEQLREDGERMNPDRSK